jgi:hypothetical protein
LRSGLESSRGLWPYFLPLFTEVSSTTTERLAVARPARGAGGAGRRGPRWTAVGESLSCRKPYTARGAGEHHRGVAQALHDPQVLSPTHGRRSATSVGSITRSSEASEVPVLEIVTDTTLHATKCVAMKCFAIRAECPTPPPCYRPSAPAGQKAEICERAA